MSDDYEHKEEQIRDELTKQSELKVCAKTLFAISQDYCLGKLSEDMFSFNVRMIAEQINKLYPNE
jgi:hypothetical protein